MTTTRTTNRKPPPALATSRVEHYAIRDRSMRYSGHSFLFVGGKELGPVPRLAICRGENDDVLLLHCDRRWRVLGIGGGHANIKAAKARAERTYPGISAAWVKTGVTKSQARRYLDKIGGNAKCHFCGKAWYQVERMVTQRKIGICDACVRDSPRSWVRTPNSERPR